MEKYRKLFSNSYQRVIAPDYHGFFEHFYEILVHSDPLIKNLFINTDMKRQVSMLEQSMSHITSFSATLEASEEMSEIAILHGKSRLNIPSIYYDIWLDCLILTVSERDTGYNVHVDTAWRVVMSPGIEYMKSFCKQDILNNK